MKDSRCGRSGTEREREMKDNLVERSQFTDCVAKRHRERETKDNLVERSQFTDCVAKRHRERERRKTT